MASSVFRRHVFVATLRDRWQRCADAVFNRAGATEGSNRTAVAVCSRRQAKTEQKRDEENCTLIDEISVRTVVFLGAFAKLRKATISIVMRARLSVRMEHFGYFLEIWHFTIFENMQRKTEFFNI